MQSAGTVRMGVGRARTAAAFRLGGVQAFAILFCIVVLSRAVSWGITTINVDEWAFAAAAAEVRRGHLPYVTFFDIKPVGASLLLAFWTRLFGTSPVALHACGATCVLATSTLLAQIVRGWTRCRIEALAAGSLYAASSVLFSGLATMTEIILAPFTCAGVLLLCSFIRSKHPRLLTACAAGLAFGVAVTLKTVPALPGTVLGALTFVAAWRRGTSPVRCAGQGAAYLIGLAAPTAAAAVTFALAGQWQAFAYANFGFMRVYMHPDPPAATVFHVLVIAAEAWPLALLVGIGFVTDVGRVLRRERIDPMGWAATVWLSCEVLAAVSPGRVTDSYFLMTLTPAAILAARSLARLTDSVTADATTRRRLLAAATTGLGLVTIVPALRTSAVALLKYPDTQRDAAALVQTHLDSSDRSLAVLSFDLLSVLVTTEATVPYRVAIPVHLFGDQTSLIGADPLATLGDLFATRPRLVLVDWVDLDHEATPAEDAAVRASLATGYHEVAAHHEDWAITGGGTYHRADIHLFQRNPDGSQASRPAT